MHSHHILEFYVCVAYTYSMFWYNQNFAFRLHKFHEGDIKIRVPFHSREIVLGDINSPRDFCQTMPEDRAWRIPRVFLDISESLIIHFMEISPTGKARSEDARRVRRWDGGIVTRLGDSIFSPKFSVVDFEPINQTDQSRERPASDLHIEIP